MKVSLIRREVIALDGTIISWTEETAQSWLFREMKVGHCSVNMERSVIQIERWEGVPWDEVWKYEAPAGCYCRVIVEEYEDRYVEKFPQWKRREYKATNWNLEVYDRVIYEMSDMETRTIWKRDLWREELHTIPFKPIHLELLYSPNLIGLLENEATKAKVHFDSLKQQSNLVL